MTESIGSALSKEHLSKSVTIDIYDRIFLDVKAMESGGVVESVVDDDDNPRDNLLEKDGLLVDEITMDALEDFFNIANVRFVGNPWTTADQEDFLGSISINCTDLNTALEQGKLKLHSDASDTYVFEGLTDFVDNFKEAHNTDEKYNESDEDTADY